MTPKQSIEIELSKTRETMARLAAVDSGMWDDSKQEEAQKAEKRFHQLEQQLRLAIAAESVPSADGGESAALNKVQSRARVSDFLRAAATGGNAMGASLEFAQSQGVADGDFPIELLETRADANTVAPGEVGVSRTPILGQIRAGSIMEFLNVRMQSVPVGARDYTVLSTGFTAAPKAAGASTDSTAGVFTNYRLLPYRMAVRATFAMEELSELAGMEAALRRDLQDAIRYQMSQEILYGTATPASATVEGFLSATSNKGLGTAAGTNAPSGVITFATSLAVLAGAIDGLYASDLNHVRLLLGTESFQKMAGVYVTNSTASALSEIKRLGGGVRASARIAAKASHVQAGLLHRTGAPGPYAVAPVWKNATAIRDQYTGSASGVIGITVHFLWNFRIIRADAYDRLALTLSS